MGSIVIALISPFVVCGPSVVLGPSVFKYLGNLLLVFSKTLLEVGVNKVKKVHGRNFEKNLNLGIKGD